MDNDCVQACDQSSTSTGEILETTELTSKETAILTADQFGTLQNNSLNSHKNGYDHGFCSEMYAVQSMSSASSKVSCVIKVVHKPKV